MSVWGKGLQRHLVMAKALELQLVSERDLGKDSAMQTAWGLSWAMEMH